MLTGLRIENLKSVQDSGRLRLRPLTILMGPNSSGKSTLLDAILLAKQTVDSKDPRNPVVMYGDYVKLGSFPEVVFRNEKARTLALEFEFSPFDVRRAASVESATVRAEFSYNRKSLQTYATRVTYTLPPTDFRIEKTSPTPHKASVEILDKDESIFRSEGHPGKFYDLPRSPRRVARWRAGSDLQLFAPWQFESQLKGVSYIGPLRTAPQRTYLAGGEMPQGVGLQGEMTLSALWASRWSKPLRQRVYKRTSDWLARFGIAATLELRRIGGSYFTCLIADPSLGVKANFADVGFGSSQLLPAIVQTLLAPAGTTIVMEQPEIHLHPAAQAVLGDFFVEQSLEGKQFIVETHSEHMVSRALTRVARRDITPDHLGILYCSRTPEGTKVERVDVDSYGRFGEGLPRGFFEQDYLEARAQMEALAGGRESARE
jgi:hypothetical protein